MNLVMDPLQLAFMRHGLLEVVLLGVASGLIGPFVVQRRLTFFAHALSHTIFPALVLAAVLRIDPAVGALLGAAATAAFVLALLRRPDIGEDSAIGIVFVGLFALGVVLIGLLRVRSRDVSAAVVGNLLGIGPGDLLLSAGLVLLLAAAVAALYRPLALVGFDPIAAQALGLPVGRLEGVMIGLMAGTIIVGVQVVGVILTVAVLVTPAATARLWARRLPTVMLLAGLLGAGSGAVGLYVAYYVPVAPAAVIVLLLTALFAVSALVGPGGLAGRRPRLEKPAVLPG